MRACFPSAGESMGYGPDLSLFAIDDHSRYVIRSLNSAQWEESIVEDAFPEKKWSSKQKADTCYFDNQITVHSKTAETLPGKAWDHNPYAWGSGKSKTEMKNSIRFVDSYTEEAKAHRIRTLEQLNQYWDLYASSTTSPAEGIMVLRKPGRPVSRRRSHRYPGMVRTAVPDVPARYRRIGGHLLLRSPFPVDKGGMYKLLGARKYETQSLPDPG